MLSVDGISLATGSSNGYDGIELLSSDLPRNGSQKGHCADFQDAKKESPKSPSGTGSSVRSG